MKYKWLYEVVAAAVRRKYPHLTVTSVNPAGEVDSWELDIKGGTEAERDAAMEFAKRYAEGWTRKPSK